MEVLSGNSAMIGTVLDSWALSTERPSHFQLFNDRSAYFKESFPKAMDEGWGWKAKKPEGDLCLEVPGIFKICCPSDIGCLQVMQGLSAF